MEEVEDVDSASEVSSLSSFGSVGSDSESLEFGCSGDTTRRAETRWKERDLGGGSNWRGSEAGLGL